LSERIFEDFLGSVKAMVKKKRTIAEQEIFQSTSKKIVTEEEELGYKREWKIKRKGGPS